MRHKEAPTVFATVVSSKISSFRKDVIDEPSHQENLLKLVVPKDDMWLDYAKRLSTGHVEAEELVSSSLAFLAESRLSTRLANPIIKFQ
ncbi:hypothetical protein VitviT2T_015888 [Vitis vinifera]|uniref:Uncharacterized protein n=1 Tax=Vitis vinifera TaxID=29760 RepID=A0ABY9CRC3_VITVI|nr:hypothetical protein VitviT2T_015888 [Vitis vinifera]